MRSVRKEPNKIGSGTLDEIKAKIAIELVEERCELREEKHKDELMQEIDRIYQDRHAFVVQVSDEGMALAKLRVAHEDDLPFC